MIFAAASGTMGEATGKAPVAVGSGSKAAKAKPSYWNLCGRPLAGAIMMAHQPFNLAARRGGEPAEAGLAKAVPTAAVIIKPHERHGDPESRPRLGGMRLGDFHEPGAQFSDWLSNRLIGQGEDPVANPTPQADRTATATAPIEHRAGLAPLLIMTFVLGAAGAAIVPAAWNKIAALNAYHFRSGGNLTDIGWSSDPLALTRMQRDNRLLSYLDFVINRATKQPYVEDFPHANPLGGEADATAGTDSPAAEPGSEGEPLPDGETVTAGPETPAEGGVRRLPSLYFDPAGGKQVIGNFATRSFAGDHAACTEIAQAMVLDARASQDALYTLADTKAIKMMRFCAANGTVITTCRNGRITISPRRPRPDDGCNGRRAL